MMKLKLIAAALLLAMTLTAVSCGGDTTTTETTDTASADTAAVTEVQPIDVPTLAQTLATSCTFSEELMENNVYLKNHTYGFAVDSCVSYAAYVPAGITPEEILVFEAKTEDDAAAEYFMARVVFSSSKPQNSLKDCVRGGPINLNSSSLGGGSIPNFFKA